MMQEQSAQADSSACILSLVGSVHLEASATITARFVLYLGPVSQKKSSSA